MRPACTAPCDQPVMLAIAVEALAIATARTRKMCPFGPGSFDDDQRPAGPLHDGLHVDNTDPECYARSDEFETPLEACRECIREALEERAIAAAGDHL